MVTCIREVVSSFMVIQKWSNVAKEIILKLFIPFNHNQIGYACMNETIIEHIKLTCWI